MTMTLESVSRIFGTQLVVNSLSLKLEPGSVTVLLGANGAGKTTLLKMISGQLNCTTGKVKLDGATVKPTRPAIRKQLMLLDAPASNDRDCVFPIIECLEDYDVDRPGVASEAADWFEQLNLVGTYGKKLQQLSKGQRFKIAMIGMFLARPKVWLLDEPYSCGLDANGLEVLNHQMMNHRKEGGIVLFSSQWPQQAIKLVDDVLVLHHGSLVWSAPASDRPDSELLMNADAGLKAVLEQVRQ